MTSSQERFLALAKEPRFKGWRMVGEPELGAKIPFFGQELRYKLETGNGTEEYVSLLRHFGWVVVFGVNTEGMVVTLCQWKPGVNCASWELPPGGIGRVKTDLSSDELLRKTQEAYTRETGYAGGTWNYLGHVMIESGKYRGATVDDHGLKAHMYLATGLEKGAEARNPNPNEIMETILVPLDEFREIVLSPNRLFKEASALPCALLALSKLGRL